ncbi:MAG: gamma-glutamyltransferase, partial [Chloroflexi bacterium]|nr:gamma-glutamyltransferase [Chloroflexota bacterium]
GGAIAAESGIPKKTIEELKRRGHKFQNAPGGFGGYQGILLDHKHGTLHGATEPRKDGAAVGY